jgi:phage terminase small subunit
MPGPAPTPKALLKLRGSWRAELNPDEPKAEICIPPMPRYLKGEARKEWERVTPLLLKTGCIANVDLANLEAYCVVYSKAKDIGKHPDKYRVSDYDRIYRLQMKLAAEFGLSPSSRTRIKVEPKAEEADPFDALSKRGGA